MPSVVSKFRKYRDNQDGNATIEFVILFPAFIFLFLTGFEAGYYMVRNVALERAVDVAIRDVRLGNGSTPGQVPGFAALKRRICDEAGIIPDCMRTVQVELQPIPRTPGGVASVAGGSVRCIDLDAPPNTNQQGTYNIGSENQMMLVRVCALSQPLFPTTGIGVGMKVDGRGNYAIVSTTAFVNEPGTRSISPSGAGGGGGGNAGGGAGGSINAGGGSPANGNGI
jgi:uncharacterized membrane protein YgcG